MMVCLIIFLPPSIKLSLFVLIYKLKFNAYMIEENFSKSCILNRQIKQENDASFAFKRHTSLLSEQSVNSESSGMIMLSAGTSTIGDSNNGRVHE